MAVREKRAPWLVAADGSSALTSLGVFGFSLSGLMSWSYWIQSNSI